MRTAAGLATALIVSLSVTATAVTQWAPGADQGQAAAQDAARRKEVSAAIVEKWAGHLQEAYKADPETWASQMAPLFERASLDLLEKARSARTFDAMNTLLLGDQAAAGSGVSVNGEPVAGDNSSATSIATSSTCR